MGFFLSFLVACMSAASNVFVKKGATKFSLVIVTWAWQAFSLIVVMPILFWLGIPSLGRNFFIFAPINVLIYLVTLFLYSASLRKTDISLAVPMLAFSPLITMICSYLISGEVPSVWAGLGVVMVMIGAYWMNAPRKKHGVLDPLKSIVKNKGVMYMFLVTLLWGVSSSLDKLIVLDSSPTFYTAFTAISITLILTPHAVIKYRKEFLTLAYPKNLKIMLPIGILEGLMILAQMTAISMTYAAYVIAVKRSSIVLSSLLGYAVFGENIKDRLKPIMLMFVGLVLIVLAR